MVVKFPRKHRDNKGSVLEIIWIILLWVLTLVAVWHCFLWLGRREPWPLDVPREPPPPLADDDPGDLRLPRWGHGTSHEGTHISGVRWPVSESGRQQLSSKGLSDRHRVDGRFLGFRHTALHGFCVHPTLTTAVKD